MIILLWNRTMSLVGQNPSLSMRRNQYTMVPANFLIYLIPNTREDQFGYWYLPEYLPSAKPRSDATRYLPTRVQNLSGAQPWSDTRPVMRS